MSKINAKFLQQLVGSLDKSTIEKDNEQSNTLNTIFSCVDKNGDSKINIEEITKFALSVFEADNVEQGGNGDGALSDNEIDSYIEKNRDLFAIKQGDTTWYKHISHKDIKNFLEFFIKNSDKTTGTDTRQDNEDGSYSISTVEDIYKEVDKQSTPTNIPQKTLQNPKTSTLNTGTSSGTIFGSQKGQVVENNSILGSTGSIFNNILQNLDRITQKEKIGTVYRTTNYSADNKILSIETTKDNITTVTDSNGKVLKIITKNQGHSDTISEYNYLDDNKKEEFVYYGENGVKSSNAPQYKNVYQNNQLIERYEYDAKGNVIRRQNYSNNEVASVTKYENGIETQTVDLHTNNIYNLADAVADGVIDNIRQNGSGDCYLLEALQELQNESWGREGLKKCIKRDIPNEGDYTIIFQKAFGEQKEFVVTKEDLKNAKQEKQKNYVFSVIKGTEIYIDGELEIATSKQQDVFIPQDNVNTNIMFVLPPNGDKKVFTIEDLDASSAYNEIPKYSSGDKDTLAFEIAYERNRAQVGLKLDGGRFEEVATCVLGDEIQCESFVNTALENNTLKTYSKSLNEYCKKQDTIMASLDLYKNCSIKYNKNLNTKLMKEKLLLLKNNFGKYSNSIGIIMDGGAHAGWIKRFEEENGEIYVVYSHPGDSAAEIKENINDFVKQLGDMTLVSKTEQTETQTNSDGKYGNYKSSDKRNLSNVTSSISAYVNAYGEDAINKMITKDEQGNITITFPNKKPVKISQKDIASATATGNYALNDDDVTALEVAIERFLNNKKHKNTVTELSHTDLENFSQEEILSLLTGNDYSINKITTTKFNNKMLDNNIIIGFNNKTKQYIYVKSVQEMPDGTRQFTVTASEDSGIDVVYNEQDFLNKFSPLTTYKK